MYLSPFPVQIKCTYPLFRFAKTRRPLHRRRLGRRVSLFSVRNIKLKVKVRVPFSSFSDAAHIKTAGQNAPGPDTAFHEVRKPVSDRSAA